jgi:hypothetical protein
MAVAVAAAVLSLVPDAAGQTSTAAAQSSLRNLHGGAWNAPRTPDGQPDVQGIWTANAPGALHSLEEGGDPENAVIQGQQAPPRERPKAMVDPTPDGKIPYQPWAAARQHENLRNIFAPTRPEHIEPEDRCLLNGVPRSNLRGQLQITQGPGYVLILYEWNHAYRFISLDERPHVGNSIKLWNGDSRGRWEGNTLVVDVTNFAADPTSFNKQPWLDSHGSFYSDALQVRERWTFVDADTIDYEAAIEDPKVFTRPWKIVFPFGRNRDNGYEFMEVACYEGHNNRHAIEGGRRLKAEGRTGIHEHTTGFYGSK